MIHQFGYYFNYELSVVRLGDIFVTSA